MSACTEPVRTGIGAVCEYGRPKWPTTMFNHTNKQTNNIPGTEKCLVLYFWHPMLVRPVMKRHFCLKAKNGLEDAESTGEHQRIQQRTNFRFFPDFVLFDGFI